MDNLIFKGIIQYPNIEILQGKATFICGESGCGKSTLLKLLNGAESAQKGGIIYNEKDINNYPPTQLRREVLLVSQYVYLFDKSIKENFYEYYSYLNIPMISDEKMKEYLTLCCMNISIDSNCCVLSGGERQRVYIAICISLMPKVLMLDEPTSALDEKTAYEVIKNIKRFCKQNSITLIVVTHNKLLAEYFADKIIILDGCAINE
jgi:putative ABC transport system ATP-binding protein